jgi:hypothetical protein
MAKGMDTILSNMRSLKDFNQGNSIMEEVMLSKKTTKM